MPPPPPPLSVAAGNVSVATVVAPDVVRDRRFLVGVLPFAVFAGTAAAAAAAAFGFDLGRDSLAGVADEKYDNTDSAPPAGVVAAAAVVVVGVGVGVGVDIDDDMNGARARAQLEPVTEATTARGRGICNGKRKAAKPRV